MKRRKVPIKVQWRVLLKSEVARMQILLLPRKAQQWSYMLAHKVIQCSLRLLVLQMNSSSSSMLLLLLISALCSPATCSIGYLARCITPAEMSNLLELKTLWSTSLSISADRTQMLPFRRRRKSTTLNRLQNLQQKRQLRRMLAQRGKYYKLIQQD